MGSSAWRRKTICAGGLALAAVAAWAQQPFAASRVADPALARCVPGLREQLNELNQALAASQARHRASPVLMSRLQTLDAELQPLRARVAREIRSLPDCETLGQSLAAEHERLARMAGPEPQVAECMAANAQALRDTLAALDTAAKAAPTRPAQAAQAQAALQRMDDLRPGLARESQNLTVCRQFSGLLAQERQQATALQSAATSPDPMAESAALAACRANVVDTYADTRQAWRDAALLAGLKAGHALLDGATSRMRQWREEVARPPAALADCQALAQSLEEEKAKAAAVATPAKPAG